MITNTQIHLLPSTPDKRYKLGHIQLNSYTNTQTRKYKNTQIYLLPSISDRRCQISTDSKIRRREKEAIAMYHTHVFYIRHVICTVQCLCC